MTQGKQGIWLSLIPGRENTGNLGTTQGKFGHREFSKFLSLKMKYFIVDCPFIGWCTPIFFNKLLAFYCFSIHIYVRFLFQHVILNMLRKGGNNGFNGVMEAIYKLKCGIFALKKHREKLQTQGQDREKTGNFTLTWVWPPCMIPKISCPTW